MSEPKLPTTAPPMLYAVLSEGLSTQLRADRGIAELVAGVRRKGDGPGDGVPTEVVEYVPAAALKAAQDEVVRLKATVRRVVESMGHSGGETPEYLPCNESCVDCDEDTIAENHRPDLPEDRCSDHPDADGELDCWRCLLIAALATKEP